MKGTRSFIFTFNFCFSSVSCHNKHATDFLLKQMDRSAYSEMKFKVSTSNYFPNLYNYYYFIEAIKRKYQSLRRQFLLEDNSDIEDITEQTAKKKKI